MQDILIVVDMQNDFIDGALGTKEAVAIVDNVKKKIEGFEGDKTKQIYESKLAEAPANHIIKEFTLEQGTKNKDKWALIINKKFDKNDSGLLQWYLDTLIELYNYIEK